MALPPGTLDGSQAEPACAPPIHACGGDRLACLDGWRGLAIALVLVGHFMPVPGWGLESTGVDLFFVLSGRLIAAILFVEAAPLDQFVWRRIARVVPSLLVFTLLVGPLHGIFGHPQPSDAPPLTFTANYVYAATGEPLFFGHLWSLCIEEHCYLALVAIAVLHRLRGGGPVMIFALGLFCLADLMFSEIVLGQRDFTVLWRTDARAGPLLLSAALHLVMRGRIGTWRARPGLPMIPVIAFLAGLALGHEGMPEVLQYGVGGLFLALAVNTLEAAPRALLRQLTCPPLLALGRWSYSLYLWQQPFFVASVLGDPSWRLPLLLAAAGAGLINLHLIEQPSRRWLNRAWTRLERRRARGPIAVSP